MSRLLQRFLLVSDMHYTTEENYKELKERYPEAKTSLAAGNAFGYTQRQKVEKIREDILEEHRRSPLDAVLILGDLSIDDYDYRKLPESYCKKFKEDCIDRLPIPCHPIPGNHDSWPNELWKEMMGCDRQYVIEYGDCVFLMADTFAATPAKKEDPASGSALTPLDERFLQEALQRYKNKKLFLCAHHLDPAVLSEESKKQIESADQLLWMYRGHTHVNSVSTLAGKPLFDIGGYGYSGELLNGKYTFNIFHFSWAWGYQILEIYEDFLRTYHVKSQNRYLADNGTFLVEETTEDEKTISLRK